MTTEHPQFDTPRSAHGACFHGGASFEAIGEGFDDLNRRHAIINADVLDAWFPPAPAVLEALSGQLPWIAQSSPPTHARGLVKAIAQARDLSPACILPGAGSSDLIFLALRQWLRPSSRVLLLAPTYGEYSYVCEQLVGCQVDRLVLQRKDDYRLDLDRLADRMHQLYDLIVLVNPNNPTGQHVPRDALAALLTDLPAHTRCWVDEAYIDYAGADQSLERFAATRPNVVVCKSLSKVYALSGLRAAYLVGAEAAMAELRPLMPPWSVSLPAQIAAVQALQSGDYYSERHRQTHVLREQLAEHIRALDPQADVLTGVTNAVLWHLPPDGPSARLLSERCRARGLFVREIEAPEPESADRLLRVAVKDDETQRRMVSMLAQARSECGQRGDA